MLENLIKEEYTEAVIEVVEFESNDIITTSSYKDDGQLEWDTIY